jgi:hypothetical protein
MCIKHTNYDNPKYHMHFRTKQHADIEFLIGFLDFKR